MSSFIKPCRRSIFNILGPLLNPAKPEYQLVGVFDPSLTSAFGEILRKLGRKSAWVVHGNAGEGLGMDELSTLGTNEVVQLKDGNLTTLTLDPAELGYDRPRLEDLAGGDAPVNADLLEGILAGRIELQIGLQRFDRTSRRCDLAIRGHGSLAHQR